MSTWMATLSSEDLGCLDRSEECGQDTSTCRRFTGTISRHIVFCVFPPRFWHRTYSSFLVELDILVNPNFYRLISRKHKVPRLKNPRSSDGNDEPEPFAFSASWRAEIVLLGHHSYASINRSHFLEVVGPKMKCCPEESYALDWLGGVVSKFCVCVALAWMLFFRWHMLSMVSWTTLSLAQTVGYHAYSLQFWLVDERMRVKGASTTKASVGIAVLAKNLVGAHIVFVLDSGTARQTQADLDKVDDTKAKEDATGYMPARQSILAFIGAIPPSNARGVTASRGTLSPSACSISGYMKNLSPKIAEEDLRSPDVK
ncbi:hypothetical protein B0H14DRAFT_3730024 [Mycena olivaceomarginata]|nr:hypothetical protein B0H14DRAFT_3730024 [Mycena olivaceomarginata]